MIKVSADQSILEAVRLSLQSTGRDIYYFDEETSLEHKVNREHLIALVASGFPAALSLKSMEAITPNLLSSTIDSSQTSLGFVMRWFISVFESLHDGVLIIDHNEIVRYINKSFERISGAVFSEIVGRDLLETRPGAKLGRVVRTGKPLLGVRRKFGEIEYMTDMHPIIINGECIGGVTIARDITEIQQLQTKLSKYQVRYNDLLRQINKENTATYRFADICGNSPALHAVKRLAEKLANSNLPVLLRGESGTGKELFAHAIHLASARHEQAFVTVNCAAIPGPLLESELFGYSEGAFSGAKQSGKSGLITLAHNGTLFLDEIGDMDIELQAKMLRVLQTGEVQPLGSVNKMKVNVRVIAATNRALEEMIRTGKFREDLFYRLNVSQVYIPPLRDRVQDISVMAEHFLGQCIHPNFGKLKLDAETLSTLESYPWPGNVRELENTIRFIANITDRNVITPDYLPQVFSQHRAEALLDQRKQTIKPDEAVSLKAMKHAAEKEMIVAALTSFGRSVQGKREAAKQLGISLTTLYARMSTLNIK
ncbi:MAG: sigma L-dependent transcriptional regulator [Anaerosporomusa subterranea]|jgi:PAS domain S-box-containing protein|nr:sigma L-dependent transcriptional regulator [Anaerosporomusa subterranea]